MRNESFKKGVLIFFLTTVVLTGVSEAGKTKAGPAGEARVFKGVGDVTMPYRVFTPTGLKEGRTYPLVLCFHGAAGRGTDNKARGSLSFSVLTSTDMQKKHPAFVVAPQCPKGKQWANTPWAKGTYDTKKVAISDEMTMALSVVDALIKELPVDKNRIYVTGRSMGGFATWDAIARRPAFFAAAVPIAGGGDPKSAVDWISLPIWAVASAGDRTCPVSGTREVVVALKKLGSKIKYTEDSKKSHGSICNAWKDVDGLGDWLFEQKKGTSERDAPAKTKDLAAQFRNPPHSAGVRCYWWWLNGNVTEEAITRDLEEMKDKGFIGALIFDADGSSQRGNHRVPAGPLFASPEWTKLFMHACKEAKRLDLELSLNIQSGWNLGGPKVTAEDAMQHLVWSKTTIQGPAVIEQALPSPKFRDFYRDVTVIAVPIPKVPNETQLPAGEEVRFILGASSSWPNNPEIMAMDGNPDTFWVSDQSPSKSSPQWLLLTLSKPVKLSELSLRGRKGYAPRNGEIQVSLDNRSFDTVNAFSLKDGETLRASFETRQVKYIRLQFTDAYDTRPVNGKARNVQVAEVGVTGIGKAEKTAGLTIRPIKDLALKSATRELGGSAPDCRFLLNTDPAQPRDVAIKQTKVLNLTAKMDASGTLRWEVPEGEWVVLRIGHTPTRAHVSTSSGKWRGRVLDHLAPSALEAYWNRNIDPLIEAVGPMAGSTLRYVHTDSWEGGGMNWTPGFGQEFQKRRGYDPTPWLPVLAGYVIHSREDSNAFLADFRKTIGDLVAGHYGLMAKLAGKYGMGTHPECSGPHAGPLDGLKNYGHSEIVMSEFWSPSLHRSTPDKRFFVKQASSAAHTYGKRLVSAEAYTTIGPHWNDISWAHMKPSLDHELCAGLNLVVHCLFTCSPKEMGMPGQETWAGTHFNPQITWWDEAKAYITYERRCQYLAQQGDFVADVVYYYGDHIPNIAALKESDPAGALPNYDYDVLSEELLHSSLAVADGKLTLSSGMAYRVLVIPDHKILSLGVLKKLDELVRAGATVLGPKPLRAVSLEGGAPGKALFQALADELWGVEDQANNVKGSRPVGKGRVVWGMPARDLLHADGIASDVTLGEGEQTSSMDWIHYRIGDAEVYFLAELAGKARSVDATFRVHGRVPELWNAVDGSIRQAATFKFVDGCTQVPLEFDSYGSMFVVFRNKSESGRNDGPNFPTWQETQVISGPWDVTFDAKWGGPTQAVRFDALTSWSEHSNPEIKYYSGKATYRTTFNLGKDLADKTLAIELGRVLDVGIARVTLNGTDLGVVWRPPFRVDATNAIKSGENKLEVMVVNSWRNRLIGDEALPKDKRFTSTNIKVTKKWKLEKSGLLGPVRIMETVTGN